MNKIDVKLVKWDDPAWYAQVACEVTRAANKYDSVESLVKYVEDNKWDPVKVDGMLKLPHSKISRFTDFTFIITGTSRRFLAQLMTHHIGISVMSGSLQYSDHSKRHLEDMFLVPNVLLEDDKSLVDEYLKTQENCFKQYESMRAQGVDNDTAGYTMPQSLRNVLLVKVNLEELKFIGNQRLCKRNTDETRYVIAKMIEEVVNKVEIDDSLFYPSCYHGNCKEGRYACGRPIQDRLYSCEDDHLYSEPFTIRDYINEEFPLLK